MYYCDQVFLRDGTPCTLRNPTAEDAQALLDLLKITSGETDFLMRYPDEIQISVEKERQFIQEMASKPNAVMIVAILNGQIVANAGLTPVAECEKCRHRASFGMAILQDYWGRGIGTLLTKAILKSAQEAGYGQIELEVLADNHRALALYEQFGFKIFGTNEHAFCFRNGTYRTSHLMTLTI